MSRSWLAVILILSLTACDEQRPDTTINADAELQAQRVKDQRIALNPAAALCHEIQAVIPVGGKVVGPDCVDNKAVVNGWSEKCVANGACNTPTRKQELNSAAKSFCADWCAAKQCDFSYSSRSNCDSAWCLNSNTCQRNCNVPKLDACYFQQAGPNYNCECKDPPPPLPTNEGKPEVEG